MSTLTLPGTIPGLLRRGSPLLAHRLGGNFPGVTTHIKHYGNPMVYLDEGLLVECLPEHVALDLTDPTGRAHAAWWLVAGRAWSELEDIVERLTGNCDLGAWLDWFTMPDQSVSQEMIAELRLVCLHVAGLPS